MYRDSAAIYDVIYGYKDYRAEAEQLTAAINACRPEARTLLDDAIGHAFTAGTSGSSTIDTIVRFADDRTLRIAMPPGGMSGH